MTIITDNPSNVESSAYFSGYKNNLKVGEGWERVVRNYFKSQGLVCERYNQNLSYLPPYSPKFAQFQRDLYIVHPRTGKRLNIEVKSRFNGETIWNYQNLLVGKCAGWDAKRFKVSVLVLVDQKTGDARVTKADALTREAEWNRVRSRDLSYSVQRHKFHPLEAYRDFLFKS